MTTTLNPATLLPANEEGILEHDCLPVKEQVYSSQPNLKDEPLTKPELKLYTDGSSFMINGERRAGYAVVTPWEEIEAQTLLPNTPAQKAEIVALTHALQLSEGKRLNIYMDSKYAFRVVHAHGAIWK